MKGWMRERYPPSTPFDAGNVTTDWTTFPIGWAFA
jgi:hypothetical protein